MGVLTDVVVAREDEAEAVASEVAPTKLWPGLDAKGHSEITFGVLHGLLAGAAPSESCETSEFRGLAVDAPEGPWVTGFPAQLVEGLASLDVAELGPLAEAWSQAEDLEGSDPEDLRTLLVQLCELSRRALGEGSTLLIWCSL